jgi:maltose alpha-D-glucosyltransferase/alpha-amylase
MKRLISIRKNVPPLARGDLQFLFPENPRVLAFTRNWEGETLLVVTNLSRFRQVVELDLSGFTAFTPREVFSQNRFPDIGEEPYRLTLGPYDFLWLSLTRQREALRPLAAGESVELSVAGSWTRVLRREARKKLETQVLPDFLASRSWYADRGRQLRRIRMVEELPLSRKDGGPILVILEAEYADDPAVQYLLPLAYAAQEQALDVLERFKSEVIARLTVDGSWGFLYDGGYSEDVHRSLHGLILGRRKIRGRWGELAGRQLPRKRVPEEMRQGFGSSRVLGESAEQSERGGLSNTSIVLDNRMYLKLYRRFEDSTNPDTEMVRTLSDTARFSGVPRYLASLEYRQSDNDFMSVALLQEYVPHQGDAWSILQGALSRYYEEVLAGERGISEGILESGSPLDGDHGRLDDAVLELIGSLYVQFTELLGARTAQMHAALASVKSDPLFAPEPFSKLYQRSLYQSLRSSILRSFRVLEGGLSKLEEEKKQEIRALLSRREDILAALMQVVENKISGMKTRVHGDYNLHQVLFTGRDFMIIDFEGEPGLASGARRLKYSPLRDVADMIRSFYYSAYGALYQHTAAHPENLGSLEPYASLWYRSVSRLFLSAYRSAMPSTGILPADEAEQNVLLRAFLLDKGIAGIVYELASRPEWLTIPVRGVQSMLSENVPGG